MPRPAHLRADGTIRRWHPAFWWVVVKAVLRYVHVLPRLCPACGGQGRQLKRRLMRRRTCPSCNGRRFKN